MLFRIMLWRDELQVLRFDVRFLRRLGPMDSARLSARAARSERAAEALQRGLDRVRRLLARPFHGRLR